MIVRWIWSAVISSHLSTRLRWAYFWISVLLAGLALAPLFVSEYSVVVLTDWLIVILFSVAFNLLLGVGGMVSFGHGAFYGLGAYGSALLATKAGFGMLGAIALGSMVAAFAGFLLGIFAVRLTNVYFSMLTLAFSQFLYYVIVRWFSLTNGDQGIQGLVRASWLESDLSYYYFVAAIVVLSLFVMYHVVKSPFGLVLSAIRDNRRRIPFIGISISLTQLYAIIISSLFSGIAGALHAYSVKSVGVTMASFNKSLEALLACLIGGSYVFPGPIIGSVVYKILETVCRLNWPSYWPFVIGSCFVFITVFWPRGVMGMLQDPRWIKWSWRLILKVLKIYVDLSWWWRWRKHVHEVKR